MVYVGSSWVEIERWSDATGRGNNAEWRIRARSVQDTDANTSGVYFNLQKSVSANTAWSYNSLYFSISGTGADGDGHNATQSWTYGTVSDTSWQDVGGDTSDMYWSGVKHDSDGKCTINATASGDRVMGGSFSTGITIELPTIARASVPSATPNPATIGSGGRVVTINTNRKSSSFLHTVSLRCGSWTWSSAAKGVGGSVNVTIPYSVIAQFAATSKTATCTITCVTYSGNTNIGTKTATFTLQIDAATDHPQVDSVTVEDLNNKSAAIEAAGSFINNASYLKATIDLSAAGSYTQLVSARVVCGSTAQSYTLSGTSQTIIFEYDKINTSDLTVYVTDKRGTTVSFVKSWTLVPYVDLTVSGSVDRLSETGNTIKFTLTGRCFAGNFGQATNQLTIKYKSKLHSATDYPAQWTTLGTVTPSGQGATTYETSGTLTGFDYDQQYDLIFHVEDLFTEAQTGEIGLTKGIPVYGNGEDFFAVYGDSFLHWDRSDPNKFWNINDALNGILAHGGEKNLLTSTGTTVTRNGITYTNNGDGTWTVNGTATADSYGVIADGYEQLSFDYPVTLSGCPEGGNGDTYWLQFYLYDGTNTARDYGDGVTVTPSGTGSRNVAIYIHAGTTVNNLVFKPMLRDARIASDTFVQPAIQTTMVNITGKSSRAQLFKYGKIVFFTSPSDGTYSSGLTNVGTIPAGYRPAAEIRIPVGNDARNTRFIIIQTTGAIQHYSNNASSSNANYGFTACWITLE